MSLTGPRSVRRRRLTGCGDKQVRVEEDAGASAQDLDSPTDLGATSLDDEMNSEMEVDGSEKGQAEQAAEANRRRQREQNEATGGDLLTQMRATMERSSDARKPRLGGKFV